MNSNIDDCRYASEYTVSRSAGNDRFRKIVRKYNEEVYKMSIDTERSVEVIPATVRSVQNGGQLNKQTNIKVAAYCRVSTGDENQQTSYTTQKAFYSDLIQSRSGWVFAGIYADEAISGTSRVHRKEFNRMMSDALAGKIDYIVTKSISRFARNTVDTLNCVRQLRQQDPPVGIYFEKENIDTLDAAGELILTILSALAQDESRSISDNIRWAFQKNFQAGKPQINLKRMLGYDKGSDGEWIINPEQAEIVRYIFSRFLYGQSANKIAQELNKLGKTTVNGKKWMAGGVLTILRNEKYVGDLEMQKTVTKDYLTHRSTINNGEAPRYYIENHHKGIIDRITWNKVQAMLYEKPRKNAELNTHKEKTKRVSSSAFSNLHCGAVIENGAETGNICGESFFRITYSGIAKEYSDERSIEATDDDANIYREKYSYAYPVWRCRRKSGKWRSKPCDKSHSGKDKRMTSAERKTANCRCPSQTLHECALEQSFMEMLYGLKRDYEKNDEASHLCQMFKSTYERTYQQIRKNSISIQQLETISEQIKELENKLQEQITVIRNTAIKGSDKLNSAVSRGDVTKNDIDKDIRNELMGINAAALPYIDFKDFPEAEIYAERAKDISRRLKDMQTEKRTLEKEQGVLVIMKTNFEFFLNCLKELPEHNTAGMELNISGVDIQEGKRRNNSFKTIKCAPDLLHFEKGIYCAFFESGTVVGDLIEYKTNFGVTLISIGNSRKLSDFLEYRKSCSGGKTILINAPYLIYDNSIQYRRYPKNNGNNKHRSEKE